MMHQPVDYEDMQFYAAETLLIRNGEARCAVLGALCAARMRIGALSVGGDPKGRAYKHDDQPTPRRRRTHREPRTGAK
jgi:hypothetical protein